MRAIYLRWLAASSVFKARVSLPRLIFTVFCSSVGHFYFHWRHKATSKNVQLRALALGRMFAASAVQWTGGDFLPCFMLQGKMCPGLETQEAVICSSYWPHLYPFLVFSRVDSSLMTAAFLTKCLLPRALLSVTFLPQCKNVCQQVPRADPVTVRKSRLSDETPGHSWWQALPCSGHLRLTIRSLRGDDNWDNILVCNSLNWLDQSPDALPEASAPEARGWPAVSMCWGVTGHILS